MQFGCFPLAIAAISTTILILRGAIVEFNFFAGRGFVLPETSFEVELDVGVVVDEVVASLHANWNESMINTISIIRNHLQRR